MQVTVCDCVTWIEMAQNCSVILCALMHSRIPTQKERESIKTVPVRRIPFKEFKKIYSRVPRLTVEVVVQHTDGSILLIRRTIPPAMGEWHTPGGTVLKGETLHEAVRRVGKEELGVSVHIIRCLGVIEYLSYKNHYSQDISIAYLVRCSLKKDFMLDGHADRYAFFPVKHLPTNTIKEQKLFYRKVL